MTDRLHPDTLARLRHVLLLHRWDIWCVDLAGHQSWRERRCLRCKPHRFQRQRLTYFGKPNGRWKESR